MLAEAHGRGALGPRLWIAGLVLLVAVIGLTGGVLVAGSAAADNPLVGEWHMDQLGNPGEGVASTPDSSGNGNDLTGSLVTLTSGRWSNAIEFNAANFDELSTSSTALQPAQLTVMAWVRGEPGPGTYKYLVAQGGDPACDPSSYALYTGGSGGLQFYISDGSHPAVVSPDAGTGIWDGMWHAVAGTYDGSTVRLYVDGQEVGSGTPSNATIDYQLATPDFTAGDYPDVNCRLARTGINDQADGEHHRGDGQPGGRSRVDVPLREPGGGQPAGPG